MYRENCCERLEKDKVDENNIKNIDEMLRTKLAHWFIQNNYKTWKLKALNKIHFLEFKVGGNWINFKDMDELEKYETEHNVNLERAIISENLMAQEAAELIFNFSVYPYHIIYFEIIDGFHYLEHKTYKNETMFFNFKKKLEDDKKRYMIYKYKIKDKK